MIRHFLILVSFFVSIQLDARQYRIYCYPSGNISTEYRQDENYQKNNVTIENTDWFVVQDKDLPKYDFISQVKCSGEKLTVDHTIKPEWMIRKEKIKTTKMEIDIELEKSNPDFINLVRLQRKIEKLKGQQ